MADLTHDCDVLRPDQALELMDVLSALSPCYFSVTVIAECAGLSTTRTAIACQRLVRRGLAEYKPLEGYARK